MSLQAPYAGDERSTLVGFLNIQRDAMIRKTEGLDDESLRRSVVPSGTTLLGLVKHLAYVERWWFRDCFRGEEVSYPGSPEDPDADLRVEQEESTADVVALYRQEIAKADAIIADAGLDDLSVRAAGRGEAAQRRSMRWILGHMIEETARHAGHADIIREQLDGATGL